MLQKHEKIYLIVLTISVIILVFCTLHLRNYCSECSEVFNQPKTKNNPIIVYTIKQTRV